MLSEHKLRMAEKQAACLKNFYSAGVEMLTVGKRDKARRMEIAAKYKLAPKRLAVARQFARQYTKAEFAVLISLRKPDGNLLQVGYVPYLLTLKWQTESEKQVRAALQLEAAENGWTAPELGAVIRSRFPKLVGKGGRRAKEVPVALLIEQTITVVSDLTARLQRSNHLDPRLIARLQSLRFEIWALDGAIPSEKKAA